MSRVESLHIRNFRGSTTPFALTCNPEKPIVLIFGENGTGKTTIVDALDVLGNRTAGSLRNKSLSASNSNLQLASIGSPQSKIDLELRSGGVAWKASLLRGKIKVDPMTGPHIRVLRRFNLQRFINAKPSERYEELQRLVTVDNAEKSEVGLGSALKRAEDDADRLTRDLTLVETQLEALWRTEGSPGDSAEGWAHLECLADTPAHSREIERLNNSSSVLRQLLRHRDSYQQALMDGMEQRDRLAAIESKIKSHDGIDAGQTIGIVEILESVGALLESANEVISCPVCEQPVSHLGLKASLTHRIDELNEFVVLSRQRKAAQHLWQRAEGQLQESWRLLVDTSERAQLYSTGSVDEYAPFTLEVDPEPTGAMDETLARLQFSQSTASSLVKAIEQLETRSRQLAEMTGRQNAVRQLLAAVGENRRLAGQAQKKVSTLRAAQVLFRQARHDFCNSILAEVAEDCNRLYQKVHPNEPMRLSGLQLHPSRRASLLQSASFEGHEDVEPQAYFSEAHLDTLGFCFWLAITKRESDNGDIIVVLDDVFSSVDSPHLKRIVELLISECTSFSQIIVTTHHAHLRDLLLGAANAAELVDLVELQPWSRDNGISRRQTHITQKPAGTEYVRELPISRLSESVAGLQLMKTIDHLYRIYKRPPVAGIDASKPALKVLEEAKDLVKLLRIQRAYDSREINPDGHFRQLCNSFYVREFSRSAHKPDSGLAAETKEREFGMLVHMFVDALSCPNCRRIPNIPSNQHFRCGCKVGITRMYPGVAIV